MGPMETAMAILGTILIVFAAYFTIHLLGNNTRKGRHGSKAIRMIDVFYIAKDRLIAVIKIGDKVYVMAMSGDGATVMDILTGEEAERFVGAVGESVPFAAGAVDKLARLLTKNKTGKASGDFAHTLENAEQRADKKSSGEDDT